MAQRNRYPGVYTRGKKVYIKYRLPDGRQVQEATKARSLSEGAEIRKRQVRSAETGTWTLLRKQEGRPSPKVAKPGGGNLKAPARMGFLRLTKHYKEVWADRRPTESSRRWQRHMLGVIEKEFGDIPVGWLGKARVEAWRDKLRQEGKSPATVRKYIYFLSGVFRRCIEQPPAGQRPLATHNPCRGLWLPEQPKGSKPFLSRDEVVKLMEALSYPEFWVLRRWALLILGTGMRAEEAMRLEWGQVDLEEGTIFLDGTQTKTQEPRAIEVPDQLAAALAAWRSNDEVGLKDRVIGRRYTVVPKQAWRNAALSAGLEWGAGKVTLRSLQTTFAMHALRGGASIEALAGQMGTSVSTLQGYYAATNRETRKAAAEVGPLRFVALKQSSQGGAMTQRESWYHLSH